MNLQEMIDQVSDELRNKKIDTKIIRWLNMSIIETAANFIFGSLHRVDQFALIGGFVDTDLGPDFHWLKTAGIPTQNRKLWPADEQRLAEDYPSYRTLEGTITHYYINGTKLGLFHVPPGSGLLSYELEVTVQRRPITLADPVEECDLPLDWHPYICQKALTRGYAYDSQETAAAESRVKERQALILLAASIYRRPDETMIVGDTNRSKRPPRPRLPVTYP